MRLLLWTAVVLLSGCSLLGGSRENEALDRARARWAASGPDAYTMTQSRHCFCPPDIGGPFRVTVREGAVVAVTGAGAAVPLERARTVEDLFDVIANAYARDAVDVRVTYDAALGYPTRIQIDYSENIADEELGFTVADLQPE